MIYKDGVLYLESDIYHQYLKSFSEKGGWFFNNRFDDDVIYLKNLHKRVNTFADKDAIPDQSNNLWIQWSNMKAMLNTTDHDYYSEIIYFTAVMAKKIDEYAVNNMLTGDSTVARLLYELNEIAVCDYSLLDIN